MRQCCVEGCDNKISNRETKLCHKHHLRFKRYGTTELTRNRVDGSQQCLVEDCERKQQTNDGYCLMHYKRQTRTGSTELPSKVDIKCKYCDRVAIARGMCGKHYQNWSRHNDPQYSDKNKSKPNYYGYTKSQGEYRVKHREVADRKLGRKLRQGEVVHHINLDKSDNIESNIYVCKNLSEHFSLHQQLNRVAGELVKLEYIIFENGKYRINI